MTQTGTYKIFLDPTGTLTGSLTITAYDVPPDATQSITPTNAGATATLSTTVPGQKIGSASCRESEQRAAFSLALTPDPRWNTTVYQAEDGIRYWSVT